MVGEQALLTRNSATNADFGRLKPAKIFTGMGMFLRQYP